MIRRLGGRRWQLLHRLIYVSAVSRVAHYLWLVKADTLRPLAYGMILTTLLVFAHGTRSLPRRRGSFRGIHPLRTGGFAPFARAQNQRHESFHEGAARLAASASATDRAARRHRGREPARARGSDSRRVSDGEVRGRVNRLLFLRRQRRRGKREKTDRPGSGPATTRSSHRNRHHELVHQEGLHLCRAPRSRSVAL
jgi:hypothetical protein